MPSKKPEVFMDLDHWVPRSEWVEVDSDIWIELFPLNGQDVLTLVDKGGDVAAKAFEEVLALLREVQPDDMNASWFKTLATSVLKKWPDLMVAIVIAGSRRPDWSDKIRSFALPVMMECLEAVVAMTIRSEGELKKLVAASPRWTDALKKTMTAFLESEIGVGASAPKSPS